jgi:hypothetical protein
MKPTTKVSDNFESVFQRLKLNQNYLSQWFLDTTTFENLIDGVNSFVQEIQNFILAIFCKMNHEFFHLKLAMRPRLIKGISIFASRAKTNPEVFSKIQMIVFLKISYHFNFIWFFVKYKRKVLWFLLFYFDKKSIIYL